MNMKKSSYKSVGIVLILCTLLVAIFLQVVNSGLVDMRPSSLHQEVIVDPQNPHVTTTKQEMVRIRLKRICPLLAIAGMGLLCILISKRKEA
jgi:hypothetical protein